MVVLDNDCNYVVSMVNNRFENGFFFKYIFFSVVTYTYLCINRCICIPDHPVFGVCTGLNVYTKIPVTAEAGCRVSTLARGRDNITFGSVKLDLNSKRVARETRTKCKCVQTQKIQQQTRVGVKSPKRGNWIGTTNILFDRSSGRSSGSASTVGEQNLLKIYHNTGAEIGDIFFIDDDGRRK